MSDKGYLSIDWNRKTTVLPPTLITSNQAIHGLLKQIPDFSFPGGKEKLEIWKGIIFHSSLNLTNFYLLVLNSIDSPTKNKVTF